MKIMNEYLKQYQMDKKKVNKFDFTYFLVTFLISLTLIFRLFYNYAYNLYWDLDKADSQSLILASSTVLFILISLSLYSRLRKVYLRKNHIELEDINGSDVFIYNNHYVLDHWNIKRLRLGKENADIKDLTVFEIFYLLFAKDKYEITSQMYYNLCELTEFSNLIGIDRVELKTCKKLNR